MADLISTAAAFDSLKFYNELGYPQAGVQPIDYYQNIHYGKVDRAQNAVYMSTHEFTNQLQPGLKHMALDFVVEAFQDLQAHFTKARAMRRISKEGIISTGLVPRSGWLDLNNLYNSYISNTLYPVLKTFLLGKGRNEKIRSYEDFLGFFKEFIKVHGELVFLTKTGFVKSSYAPRRISGLIVELAGGTFGDIPSKERWINDINFNFYRNAASKYGFLVDKSAPWCLIANVSSIEMQSYWIEKKNPTPAEVEIGRAQGLTDKQIIEQYSETISKRGLIFKPGDASNLFEVYYKKAHHQDLDVLSSNLIRLYNTFVEEFPAAKIYKSYPLHRVVLCSPFMVETIYRPQIDPTVAANLQSSSIMELYLLCRQKEEKLELTPVKLKHIQQKAAYLEKKLDIFRALDYINSQIKKLKYPNLNSLYCQNYQMCGIKKSEELGYNSYVPDPNQ